MEKLQEQNQKQVQSMQILNLLLEHPFQRVKDIALALHLSPATAHRYLQQTYHQGYIDWVIPPSLRRSNTYRLYYLSKTGLQTLAAHLKCDVSSLSTAFGVTETRMLHLLPRLGCLVTLQDLIGKFIRDGDLIFSHPHDQKTDLSLKWVLDYEYHFDYRQKRQRLCADAFLALRFKPHPEASDQEDITFPITNATCYATWIMIDMGLNGKDDLKLIRHRLEMLLRYRECRKRVEDGVYSHFPPVLIIVQSAHQREYWQQCADEVMEKGKGRSPLLGAIIETSNITSPLSARQWITHALDKDSASHFSQLFKKIPLKALPPGIYLPSPIEKPREITERLPLCNYSLRAESIPSEEQSEEKERQIAPLLWLILNHRHMEILHMLYVHPLLTTAEIAAFMSITIASAQRYLSDLKTRCCVKQHHPTERWELGRRGLRLIAASLHVPLIHIAKKARTEEGSHSILRGQQFLQSNQAIHHTAALYHFVASLHRDVQKYGKDYRIPWWDQGFRCERRFYVHKILYFVRPDATFEIQAQNHVMMAWLEIDCGTMDTTHFRKKFASYNTYIHSDTWSKEKRSFAPVLFMVVPDQGQLKRVARVIHEFSLLEELIIRIATVSQIELNGPLGKSWYELVPHTQGVTLVKRSLLDRSKSIKMKKEG